MGTNINLLGREWYYKKKKMSVMETKTLKKM